MHCTRLLSEQSHQVRWDHDSTQGLCIHRKPARSLAIRVPSRYFEFQKHGLRVVPGGFFQRTRQVLSAVKFPVSQWLRGKERLPDLTVHESQKQSGDYKMSIKTPFS